MPKNYILCQEEPNGGKKTLRLTITFYSYHVSISMLLWHLTVINYCDDVTLPYWFVWLLHILCDIVDKYTGLSEPTCERAEIVINKISGKWYKKYQWKCEKYVVEVGLF